MRLLKLPFILLALCCHAMTASDDSTSKIAAIQPTWRELPGVDGRLHSLVDLRQEVVVVAITCNHCPIALEYFGRLREFVDRFCQPEGKVALVAISLSNRETDKLDRMKQLAAREHFNFPYLHDTTQSVGKQLSATVTPQFFVLNRDRSLVYRGAWDNHVNGSKVTAHYVQDVVQSLLDGKTPPVKETRAIGCAIVYDDAAPKK